MRHDEPRAREAFRQGARDAFESCAIHMGAPEKQAVTQWLDELDDRDGKARRWIWSGIG